MPSSRPLARALAIAAVLWVVVQGGSSATTPVTVTREFCSAALARKGTTPLDASAVAVWLKPVGAPPAGRAPAVGAGGRFKIVQHHKRFDPHILVVPVGAFVEFPNLDPFFHNVFSLFDGKRFDLRLYEAGTSRGVTLNSPGPCYVFCNIHPDMSAVILVVDSPHYGTSNASGEVSVPNVPPGRYLVSIWHERYTPESPTEFPKTITVSQASASLGTIRLVDSGRMPAEHKDKFGHDYAPPPKSPLYP